MIQEAELPTLLFFDLETSSEYETFEELSEKNPRKSELWIKKHDKAKVKDPERWSKSYKETYEEMSPLNAEFGRIVCGSFSYFVNMSISGKMVWSGKMKSFYDTKATDTSEVEEVLIPISNLLTNIERAGKSMRLCGHNIKKFDIPWLAKRMLMNDVPVPPQLQVWGKKPWEITHLDTGELWSMGNWDGYVTLDLLSCSLGVPSPKTNMSGEYVGREFWQEKNYEKIKTYCEEDVKCVGKICHRLAGSVVPVSF
jgi:DNA polymerase elongation subunit (family B)